MRPHTGLFVPLAHVVGIDRVVLPQELEGYPLCFGVDSTVVQADKAPTSNMRKASLVRAAWRHTAIEEDMAIEEDLQVKKAFIFLRECNAIYDDYVRQWHDEATQRAQTSSCWIESANPIGGVYLYIIIMIIIIMIVIIVIKFLIDLYQLASML